MAKAKFSTFLSVDGEVTECDCKDATCFAACISDFYTTLAQLTAPPDCHEAVAACPAGKGRTLTILGYGVINGKVTTPVLLPVEGLDDATFKATKAAFQQCCARVTKKAAGAP